MTRYLLILSLLYISACSSDITRYQFNTPKLEPTTFFSGRLCAWGTVHDFSGDVTRRFIADITATAEDSSFVLDEVFLFDDGSKQTRLWTFTKEVNGWIGMAHDVVGPAEAQFSGNMMSLVYELEIKLDDDLIVVSMDDKLHLVDEYNLIGKTVMNKYGIKVGEINLLMQKQQHATQCAINQDAIS